MALIVASTRGAVPSGWQPPASNNKPALPILHKHREARAVATAKARVAQAVATVKGGGIPGSRGFTNGAVRPWDPRPFVGMPAVVCRTTVDPAPRTARALSVGTGHTLAGHGRGVVTFNTNTPSSRLGGVSLRPLKNRPRPR